MGLAREFHLAKFKKGDWVLVEENGNATKYEIVSVLSSKSTKAVGESCYEARNSVTGNKKTIIEEDILRLATPVDSSADLFPK